MDVKDVNKDEEVLLKMRQIAVKAACSVGHISRLTAANAIPFHRFGHGYRYSWSEIMAQSKGGAL